MTDRPAPSRSSRLRQREAMLNGVAKLIGCIALVVTVAVVFYVTITQMDRQSPPIDPAYMEGAADPLAGYRWSGTEGQAKDARLNLQRPVLNPAAAGAVPTVETASGSLPVSAAAPRYAHLAETLPGPQGGTGSQTTPGVADLEKKRPKIEATIRQFFTATTVEEKAACSRESTRVAPLMQSYYRSRILSAGRWQGLGWVLPMDEPGQRLAYAQTLFTDTEPVCVIIQETEDGSILVDWESSVRYSELDWKDFLSTKPDQPTLFRVIASRPDAATAATEAPPHPGQEVIELKHPAEQGTVYAYFNRDDPQFHSLLEQLKLGNWTNVPLTLRLCYPGPTSSARSVRIATIEGKGWLILQNRRS